MSTLAERLIAAAETRKLIDETNGQADIVTDYLVSLSAVDLRLAGMALRGSTPPAPAQDSEAATLLEQKHGDAPTSETLCSDWEFSVKTSRLIAHRLGENVTFQVLRDSWRLTNLWSRAARKEVDEALKAVVSWPDRPLRTLPS